MVEKYISLFVISYFLFSYFAVGLWVRITYTREQFKEYPDELIYAPFSFACLVFSFVGHLLFLLVLYPVAWLVTWGLIENPIIFTRNFFKGR